MNWKRLPRWFSYFGFHYDTNHRIYHHPWLWSVVSAWRLHGPLVGTSPSLCHLPVGIRVGHDSYCVPLPFYGIIRAWKPCY